MPFSAVAEARPSSTLPNEDANSLTAVASTARHWMVKNVLGKAKAWTRRGSVGDFFRSASSSPVHTPRSHAPDEALASGPAGTRSPRKASTSSPTRSLSSSTSPPALVADASAKPRAFGEKEAPPRDAFKLGKIYELLPGRLSLVTVDGEHMAHAYIERHPDLFFFSTHFHEHYEPFCSDFGPVNLGAVHDFCASLREYWDLPVLAGRHLVYYSEEPLDLRTNAAFLLAAFMVVELGATPEQAWAAFGGVGEGAFATFRDATFCTQDYHLTIEACLQGLYKAMESGWYSRDTFCSEEYKYLDNPCNADMHAVSPKFVAFKGPLAARREVAPGVWTFTPRHYTEVFQELGVSAVVRLNEAKYDPVGFTREGFRHYDLYFDDCTTPDAAIVDRFLEICEAEKGMVAVHCKAGLGRTGTLIAIYFMKHHGWTASECIGWLRIVRPGSVIGPQQQYLHWAEGLCRKGCARGGGGRAPAPEFTHALSLNESEALGLQVAAAQNARAGKRGRGRAATPSPLPSPLGALAASAGSVGHGSLLDREGSARSGGSQVSSPLTGLVRHPLAAHVPPRPASRRCLTEEDDDEGAPQLAKASFRSSCALAALTHPCSGISMDGEEELFSKLQMEEVCG